MAWNDLKPLTRRISAVALIWGFGGRSVFDPGQRHVDVRGSRRCFAAIVRTSPGMTLKSMFVRSMLLAVLFARVKAYFWIPPETPVAEVS